jgi:hypothetical protein
MFLKAIHKLVLAVSVVLFTFICVPGQAAVTIYMYQSGPDVVASYSGTVNLTGLTLSGNSACSATGRVSPSPSLICVGNSNSVDYYTGFTAMPGALGLGGVVEEATSSTGAGIGLASLTGVIGVQAGYVSGSPLSGTSTWNGRTISNLGLTNGTYVWSWTSDNVTLVIIGPPSVTAISPTSGPTAGGTSITITGTNFSGATAVQFGAANATSFTVNSATQITATAPAGSAGTVDITVTTAGGTSSTSAADQFTYDAAPTVTAISPTSGPTAGGTSITITGTNLTGATAISVGGVGCLAFSVTNSTTATCTSPAGTAGTASVLVTTPDGANAANTLFTYVATVAASIPTLSEWALIFLASLMAMLGFVRMRRQ